MLIQVLSLVIQINLWGDEFFIASHTLLFEQGVINQNIEIKKWEDMPIFFETNKNGVFPFDIFASSFFLLTRYEESLPHVKTDLGHFNFWTVLHTKIIS